MAKFLVAIALTAVTCLAAKERAWQTGRLLDNRDTHYFTTAEISNGASKDGVKDQYGGIDYSTNSPGAAITVFENFMFESPDAVYLVQVARLRSARPIRVSAIVPVKLAVENKKLWFVDQEGAEYQASILKMVSKQGTLVAKQEPAKAPAPAVQPEPKPAPVTVAVKAPEPKPAPVVKPAPEPKPAPVVKPAPAPPQETAVVRPAPAPVPEEPVTVKPAPAPKPEPVAIAKQIQKPDPATVRPTPAPAAAAPPPKPEPKPPVVIIRPDPKAVAPKPAPKEESPTPTRAEAAAPRPIKDRAWQSGQLLSTVANQYFVNVNYTTDTDADTWTMVQGNDGRFTLVSQSKPYANGYTYDNYVIESQFCAYLVQRWRAKSTPIARFPGATPMRFAVEKNKVYVLDEDGKEYETKIVKLVQRDVIDTHTHVAVGR